MFDANSIAKSILTSGQNLQTLNPRQIGILATDPATKDTQIGLSAEDWITTAPATWWTGWDKPNPTAIWDIGGNLTPLPKTGASLLNPIYDPVPGYEFKPPASAAYEPGRYMSGTGGTTDTSSLTQLQQNLGLEGATTGTSAITTLAGQNGVATQPTSVVQPVTTATDQCRTLTPA